MYLAFVGYLVAFYCFAENGDFTSNVYPSFVKVEVLTVAIARGRVWVCVSGGLCKWGVG